MLTFQDVVSDSHAACCFADDTMFIDDTREDIISKVENAGRNFF